MAYQSPSDYSRIAELKEEQDRIRDILFFQSISSIGQSSIFGQGRRSSDLGSEMGAKSQIPLEAPITDVDENGVSTGIFDKIDIQSITNIVTSVADPIILKVIQFVSDGKIFSVTPEAGKTMEITPGANIDVASTITLTDKDQCYMQFFAATGKVKCVSSGAAAASGANQALSNLTSPTSINQDLIPQANKDLGNSGNPWQNAWANILRLPPGVASPTVGSGSRISTDVFDDMEFNVENATDIYRFYFNGSNLWLLNQEALVGDKVELSVWLKLFFTVTDPATDGEFRRNVNDVKVHSGGAVRNFTDMAEKAKTNTYSGINTFNNQVNLLANTQIGDSTSDDVDILARVTSDIIPDVDDLYNLGQATLRWAILYLDSWIDIQEGLAAGFSPVGTTDRAKLFCRPSGGGKTELRVKFQTGTSVLIAIEP